MAESKFIGGFRKGKLLIVRDFSSESQDPNVKAEKTSLFFGILLAFACLGVPDDGIWLLNEFPRVTIMAKLCFGVSGSFFKNLPLGSMRFNNEGSGSFVSAEGLVFPSSM